MHTVVLIFFYICQPNLIKTTLVFSFNFIFYIWHWLGTMNILSNNLNTNPDNLRWYCYHGDVNLSQLELAGRAVKSSSASSLFVNCVFCWIQLFFLSAGGEVIQRASLKTNSIFGFTCMLWVGRSRIKGAKSRMHQLHGLKKKDEIWWIKYDPVYASSQICLSISSRWIFYVSPQVHSNFNFLTPR